MSRSSSSSSYSQDEDRRAPGVVIRGMGEHVKDPPPPPVISQFGGAFVESHSLPPATPQRKREHESSQSQASNCSSEEKRRRTRHSPSHGYSRSYEHGRSSSAENLGDNSEEIINESKKIKDFRKLVEERKEFEERHQNDLKTAIKVVAQEILDLKNVIRKRDDKIKKLKDEVKDLNYDLRKSEDKVKEKEDEHWDLKVVFEDTNKDLEKLKELYKKQEDDLQKSDTTIKRLEAEKSKLQENIDNLKKQKDEAMKKQKESENQLNGLKKDTEKLQEQLKQETANWNQIKVESQRNLKVANDKITNLQNELKEAIKSDEESKEGLVKAAEERSRLTKENANLSVSLTFQTTENELLKEKIARLQETNKNLSTEAAQGDRNMKAFLEGFMEKYEDEQSTSKSNLEEWVRATKQRLNINDVDSDILQEGKSTSRTINPKCTRSRQPPEGDEVINIMKIIMGSIVESNPETSVIGRRKSPTTTEEIPLISSSTQHNSVEMEPGYRRPSQTGNVIATPSPSTNICQRDVSDKTVSSSENIQTSPSQSTSRGPNAFRPEAVPGQDMGFFLSLSPIPQNRSIGISPTVLSSNDARQKHCAWCQKDFQTSLMAVKHVCENPQDPRVLKHQQKK